MPNDRGPKEGQILWEGEEEKDGWTVECKVSGERQIS